MIKQKNEEDLEEEKKVYERLYSRKLSKEKLEISNISYSQNNSFCPLISAKSKNLHRQGNVQDNLYNDAMRRNSLKNKKINSDAEKNSLMRRQNSVIISKNSETILEEKFLKQFDNITERYYKVDYISLGEIVKELGFTSEYSTEFVSKYSNFDQERKLINKIWTFLIENSQCKFDSIYKPNLAVFLLAILGLNFTKRNYFNGYYSSANELLKDTENFNSLESFEKIEDKIIGDLSFEKTNNKILAFSKDEIISIQQEFNLFYRIKIENDNCKNKYKEKNDFTPKISENSKILAEYRRKRILNDFIKEKKRSHIKEKNFSHAELLLLEQENNKKRIEIQRENLIINEANECSFRPQINNNFNSVRIKKSNSRNLELFHLAKQNSAKQDRDKNEIEFEKCAFECTFKPITTVKNNRKCQKVNSNKNNVIKNAEKTIERMRNARKDREFINSWKERGIPFSDKNKLIKDKISNKNSNNSKKKGSFFFLIRFNFIFF